MKLSPEHRRYLLVEQVIAGVIINVAIAAVLGWLFFRNVERVPIAGFKGAMVDTIVSAFMIAFATCLAVTRVARRDVCRGRIAPLRGGTVSAMMPRSIAARAILLGSLCAAAVALMLMAASVRFGERDVLLRHFMIFKLGFAAVEGALITPLIAFVAISRIADAHR